MFRKKVESLYIIADLHWSDDFDGEDLQDAIDHANLMRQRHGDPGIGDVEDTGVKKMDPAKLLPKIAFKGKEKGWLKQVPEQDWISEFKKVFGRDLTQILKMSEEDGINLPITIDGDLSDGYARTLFAYSLGEEVPVVDFKVVTDA